MGYRSLLKSYMRLVDSMVGSTLVEAASPDHRLFSERDLGELRSIESELWRDRRRDPQFNELDADPLVDSQFALQRLVARHAIDADALETNVGVTVQPSTCSRAELAAIATELLQLALERAE